MTRKCNVLHNSFCIKQYFRILQVLLELTRFYFCCTESFQELQSFPLIGLTPKQSLGKSITFQSEIKPLLETAIESIGTILKLGIAFTSLQSDPVV